MFEIFSPEILLLCSMKTIFAAGNRLIHSFFELFLVKVLKKDV